MKRYEWMVRYTSQTEWIERRAMLLWLAFFFIELGAGIFFIASFFDTLLAMAVGWLVCGVLGGGLHLLYLGKPLRFFQIVLRPQTSWISRGLIFVALFLILGLACMASTLWASLPTVLLVATNIFAFLTVIYGGFAMNYIGNGGRIRALQLILGHSSLAVTEQYLQWEAKDLKEDFGKVVANEMGIAPKSKEDFVKNLVKVVMKEVG